MVELHLSKVTHGVASMVKQNQITIPSKGMVKMMQGGFHFMLMHQKRVLRAGDKIKITLGFADGSKQTFQAPIKKAPAAAGAFFIGAWKVCLEPSAKPNVIFILSPALSTRF